MKPKDFISLSSGSEDEVKNIDMRNRCINPDMPECQYWLKAGCAFFDCKYNHDPEREGFLLQKNFQKLDCVFWMSGNCGRKVCTYKHDPEKEGVLLKKEKQIETFPNQNPLVVPYTGQQTVSYTYPQMVPLTNPQMIPLTNPQMIPLTNPQMISLTNPQMIPLTNPQMNFKFQIINKSSEKIFVKGRDISFENNKYNILNNQYKSLEVKANSNLILKSDEMKIHGLKPIENNFSNFDIVVYYNYNEITTKYKRMYIHYDLNTKNWRITYEDKNDKETSPHKVNICFCSHQIPSILEIIE